MIFLPLEETGMSASGSEGGEEGESAARERWVGLVVSRAREAIRAAGARPGGRGARGASSGLAGSEFDPPSVAPVAEAREAAAFLSASAATDALVSRSRLLYAMASGAKDTSSLASGLRYSAQAARDALGFSERLEGAVADAKRPAAVGAAVAKGAAEAKRVRAAEAKESLAASGDKELRKRLVREIEALRSGKREDEEAYEGSVHSPVYSVAADIGLEDAASRVGLSLDYRGRRVRGGAVILQSGGKAYPQSPPAQQAPPPFVEGYSDQLQWPSLVPYWLSSYP